MRHAAWIVLVALGACSGGSSQPSPSASPTPPVAPPPVAPPSAPPAVAPAAPPAPPVCTTVGTSVVVSQDRANPVAYVGTNGVVIVDRPRPVSIDEALDEVPVERCVVAETPRALPLPLAAPLTPHWSGDCFTALQMLRVNGRVLMMSCTALPEEGGPSGACDIRDPLADTAPVRIEGTQEQYRTVGGAAVVGSSVIVGVVFEDELRALAVTTSGALASAGTARIGTPGDSLADLLSSEVFVRVDAVSDTEAVIYTGRKNGGVFQAIHVGPTAHRIGEPTRERLASAPPRPALAAVTQRPGHHVPSFVGLARDGVLPTAPIGGIDATVSTFSPTLVVRGTRGVMSWSEGTGHSTHIRAAIVELASGAITGPTVEVSTPGVEAGYATLDSFGDHTVVTWDQKNGDAWEVRAVDLRCTGLGDAP